MPADRSAISTTALACLLGAGGLAHFLAPAAYASIVPRALGDPLPWVYGSGVAEIACAMALLARRSRRPAAIAAAALFVAVFPANVQMAVTAQRSERASTVLKVGTVARLPLQVPLVWWALSVARRARCPEPEPQEGR